MSSKRAEAPADVPEGFEWLDPLARDLWRRLAPELRRRDYLRVCDEPKFAACCQSYAAWVHAEELLAVEGQVYTTPSGLRRPHPAVGLAREALKSFNRLAGQFGLSPVDRRALPMPPGGWGER